MIRIRHTNFDHSVKRKNNSYNQNNNIDEQTSQKQDIGYQINTSCPDFSQSEQQPLDNDYIIQENIEQENQQAFLRTREDRHKLQTQFSNDNFDHHNPLTKSASWVDLCFKENDEYIKSQNITPKQLADMQNLSSLLLKIENYVMIGDINKIYEIMKFWDRNFWEHKHNKELHYRLWKTYFIEKNSSNQTGMALDIARSKLSTLAEGDPQLENDIKQCISHLMDNLLGINNNSDVDKEHLSSETNKDQNQEEKRGGREIESHLQELAHDISQRLRNDLNVKVPTLQTLILILVDNFAYQSSTLCFEVPEELQEVIGLSKLQQLIKQISNLEQDSFQQKPNDDNQDLLNPSKSEKRSHRHTQAPLGQTVNQNQVNSQSSITLQSSNRVQQHQRPINQPLTDNGPPNIITYSNNSISNNNINNNSNSNRNVNNIGNSGNGIYNNSVNTNTTGSTDIDNNNRRSNPDRRNSVQARYDGSSLQSELFLETMLQDYMDQQHNEHLSNDNETDNSLFDQLQGRRPVSDVLRYRWTDSRFTLDSRQEHALSSSLPSDVVSIPNTGTGLYNTSTLERRGARERAQQITRDYAHANYEREIRRLQAQISRAFNSRRSSDEQVQGQEIANEEQSVVSVQDGTDHPPLNHQQLQELIRTSQRIRFQDLEQSLDDTNMYNQEMSRRVRQIRNSMIRYETMRGDDLPLRDLIVSNSHRRSDLLQNRTARLDIHESTTNNNSSSNGNTDEQLQNRQGDVGRSLRNNQLTQQLYGGPNNENGTDMEGSLRITEELFRGLNSDLVHNTQQDVQQEDTSEQEDLFS